jgi:hypothetical protein
VSTPTFIRSNESQTSNRGNGFSTPSTAPVNLFFWPGKIHYFLYSAVDRLLIKHGVQWLSMYSRIVMG